MVAPFLLFEWERGFRYFRGRLSTCGERLAQGCLGRSDPRATPCHGQAVRGELEHAGLNIEPVLVERFLAELDDGQEVCERFGAGFDLHRDAPVLVEDQRQHWSNATCASTAPDGAGPLREGGRHSYWGFDPERSTALPRHREISWPFARKICKQLGIPPPSGPR